MDNRVIMGKHQVCCSKGGLYSKDVLRDRLAFSQVISNGAQGDDHSINQWRYCDCFFKKNYFENNQLELNKIYKTKPLGSKCVKGLQEHWSFNLFQI